MELHRATGRIVTAAAFAVLTGLATSSAVAQADKYQLPLKPGAWLVRTVSEHDGKRHAPLAPEDLPLKFHDEQLQKGIVHEGGGRHTMCMTEEKRNLSAALAQAKAQGCETEISLFTPKRVESTTSCPKLNAVTSAVTAIQDAQNYSTVANTRLEYDGRAIQSQVVSAATWLGSDCQKILGERYAIVRSAVEHKDARYQADRQSLEREQAAAAKEEPDVANNDTAVLMQGLLQGLQQYADAKNLRKQPQQRVAPMQTYTPPQRRQPITINTTPPTMFNGGTQDERADLGGSATGVGAGGSAGQCQTTGSDVEARRAYDRCTCNVISPGKFVFEDRGGKGWVCLSLPGRRLYRGCSLDSGKLSCTQV